MEKTLIGWNEYVDLPGWKVKRLRAKVDTGARTSALHVDAIQRLARDRVAFDIVVHREKRDRHVHVVAPIARISRVRSSNGHYEQRVFVRCKLQLGPIQKRIEVSLVDRTKMIHRMLLGRTALEGDFLVDVSRKHLLDPPKRTSRRSAR